jgi:hypothetical protein
MSLLYPIDPITYLTELTDVPDAHIMVWTKGTDGLPADPPPMILLQFGTALTRPLRPRIGEHALYFDGMSFGMAARTVRIPWPNIMSLLLGNPETPAVFVRFRDAPPAPEVEKEEPSETPRKQRGGLRAIDGGKK